MAVLHIQVESPKYESMLPACCRAKVHKEKANVIIWESYIDYKTNRVVYLTSALGRYFMLPESDIEEATVEHICGWEEYNGNGNDSKVTD